MSCKAILYVIMLTTFMSSPLLHAQDTSEKNNINSKKISDSAIDMKEALRAKGVNCELEQRFIFLGQSSEVLTILVISTEGEHYLNKLAKSMDQLGVELIYGLNFLISPDSRAAFIWQSDKLSPRTSISLSSNFLNSFGNMDKIALRHETRHFLLYILKALGYDSMYTTSITNIEKDQDKTPYSKNFFLDEIPVYVEDISSLIKYIESEYKKLYITQHPELNSILEDINSDAELIPLGLPEDIMTVANRLNNLIYSYIGHSNSRQEDKLDDLLDILYTIDENKKEQMKKRILALGSRDLVNETNEHLKKYGINTDETENIHLSIKKILDNYGKDLTRSHKTLKRLIIDSIKNIELAQKLKGQPSFYVAEVGAWYYSQNNFWDSYISHQSSYNNISNNWTHEFIVKAKPLGSRLANEIYRTTISSSEQNINLNDLLFKRIDEQLEALREYYTHVSNMEDIMDSFNPESLKDIDPKYMFSIMNNINEAKKIADAMKGINKQTRTKTPNIKDRILIWKEVVRSNKEKTTFPILNFESMIEKEPVLLFNYKEAQNITDELLLKLAKQDYRITEEDLNLLFGELNEAGERSGGIYDYWLMNIADANNWMYIAMLGALVYEDHAYERDIATKICKAYSNAGLINKPVDMIINELKLAQLLPATKSDLVIRNIIMIRPRSPIIKDIKGR